MRLGNLLDSVNDALDCSQFLSLKQFFGIFRAKMRWSIVQAVQWSSIQPLLEALLQAAQHEALSGLPLIPATESGSLQSSEEKHLVNLEANGEKSGLNSSLRSALTKTARRRERKQGKDPEREQGDVRQGDLTSIWTLQPRPPLELQPEGIPAQVHPAFKN